VFLTIAVPVQLGGPWIGVAWAVEGAVLIWLSSVMRMSPPRWMGMAVFLIFAAWLLFIDTPDALTADLRPVLNVYTVSYLAAIGATYLVAYLGNHILHAGLYSNGVSRQALALLQVYNSHFLN
jgi:hypothetical protein